MFVSQVDGHPASDGIDAWIGDGIESAKTLELISSMQMALAKWWGKEYREDRGHVEVGGEG